MSETLTLERLRKAVTEGAAAFRCCTTLQPAGGEGDKVFPATYEGGKYATEKRRLPGVAEPADCVLLDSVQSQANRMELALLEAWERERVGLPVIVVDFSKSPDASGLKKVLRITSLEAPHRVADALLRDSLLNGKRFRTSPEGEKLDHVDIHNATALFELCPTALLFGMWDSTGPRGGAGAKFQRAIVSEIIGYGSVEGVKTSSRIDPAEIRLGAGPLYRAKDAGWTLDPKEAAKDKKGPIKLGEEGKPSEANHGNVTPTITAGGVTLAKALQTTVISLPALRRLRFPIDGKFSAHADQAAHVVLAALGLCAAALAREQGYDLRSRCQLVPAGNIEWELIGKPGDPAVGFELSGDAAIKLLKDAVAESKKSKLPWMEKELVLTPSPELVALVKKSQELAAAIGENQEGAQP